ncbi:STAS domain-containing protein [bacterium]|nr:STAS domain-containing protein [bacterium]
MDLRIDSDERTCLLTVSGSLQRDVVDKAKMQIQPCLDPCKNRVVLDLSQVECIDSSGIGLLISNYGESRAKKFEFVVVRPRHCHAHAAQLHASGSHHSLRGRPLRAEGRAVARGRAPCAPCRCPLRRCAFFVNVG